MAAMTDLTPREIVSELDRFIIGQDAAKRAVAVALRNRWRQKQLPPEPRPGGDAQEHPDDRPHRRGQDRDQPPPRPPRPAPFLKVEATKFTEVGYVGRDVEQIVRDLLDAAIVQTRERCARTSAPAPSGRRGPRRHRASPARTRRPGTRETFRRKLKSGELDRPVIELELADSSQPARDAGPRPSRPAGHRHGLARRPLRQGHAPHTRSA
jgi:ATP-dependent HslUV protease ATP-binding subunit HslU